MAGEVTLARRYAKALLDVTLPTKEYEQVELDLYGIADAFDSSHDLRGFLGSPSFSRDRKKAVIRALCAGKAKEVTLRFTDLLLDKGRFSLIRKIAEAFDELNDVATDTAKVTVRSFMPLKAAQKDALLAKIRAFTKRSKIRLVEKVDTSLLGGLVVRIGDTVLDGSVKGRLHKMQQRLTLGEDERSARAAGMASEALSAKG